jgi:hypothetical protein
MTIKKLRRIVLECIAFHDSNVKAMQRGCPSKEKMQEIYLKKHSERNKR